MLASNSQWRPRSTRGDASSACVWSRGNQRSAEDAGDTGSNATTIHMSISTIDRAMGRTTLELGHRRPGRSITHGLNRATSRLGGGHRVQDSAKSDPSREGNIQRTQSTPSTTRAREREAARKHLRLLHNGCHLHHCHLTWRRMHRLQHQLKPRSWECHLPHQCSPLPSQPLARTRRSSTP